MRYPAILSIREVLHSRLLIQLGLCFGLSQDAFYFFIQKEPLCGSTFALLPRPTELASWSLALWILETKASTIENRTENNLGK